MPLKQGSNALVTKLPFQTQDKPALGTLTDVAVFSDSFLTLARRSFANWLSDHALNPPHRNHD